MDNHHFFCRMFLHVFCQQSSMTILWCLFATKKTRTIELLNAIFTQDIPLFKHRSIDSFIFFPRHLLFMPFIKQIFCRSKVCNMLIWNMADFFYEKLQVLSFGETSQLATITDANVNQLFYMIPTLFYRIFFPLRIYPLIFWSI